MHAYNLSKHIFLSGFMGTGKSTIGPLLANKLNLPFIDTDTIIQKKLNQSISDIFKKNGEPFFRSLEHSVIQSTRALPPHVISLGGGAILAFRNRNILKDGIWINLEASAAHIYSRVKNSKTRPLLDKKITQEFIQDFLNSRRPFYNLAPYKVETGGCAPEAIVLNILKLLKNHENN